MEKYGTDVQAQQRAELDAIYSQLELLRGFWFNRTLSREADSAEIKRLEQRATELERALAHPSGGKGARE